jgi:hypothetical protein
MLRGFTVTNSGDLASAPIGPALTGPNAGDFVIAGDDCLGQPLPGHESCVVGVRFRPLSAGAKSATLTIGGLAVPLSGTGHQPATTGSAGGGNASPPPPSPGPPPASDVIAPVIAELTKAVQRIAAAIAGRFSASISVNEAGTWKVQVFGRGPLARAAAARRKLVASVTVAVPAAGDWKAKVPFKAAAKRRLRRLRTARLEVRSTFTDASGNKSTTTRKVKLRR